MEENKNIAPASAGAAKTDSANHSARPNGRYNNGGRPQGQRDGRKFGNRGRFGRRDEEKLYDEKVVKISRVAKVIKGGKRVRFTALVVIGDHKGKFGYGLGKSNEVPDAIKKALAAARKNMFKISIAKGDTITHTVIGHFGATKVFLKPAPAGTGLIAGGAVRAILELSGVKNVFSKIYGSRTQNNCVRATVDGLGQLKTFANVQLVRHGVDINKNAEEAAKAPEAK